MSKKIDLNNYDSIIFDFGGVIINIDYQATINAFSKLAGFDVTNLYTQHKQSKLFDDFECGFISAGEFRNGLKELLNIDNGDEEIDEAWNLMLLDIPTERIELLDELSKSKKLFLLSNTNCIHKEVFDRSFEEKFGDKLEGKHKNLDSLFIKAYYSHLVGDRKPKESIFYKVLEEQKLNPQKTLFIEDTIQHIEAAKKLSIQTYHLQKGEEITSLFE